MKLIGKKIIRLWLSLLGGILSLFGVTSCGIILAYGVEPPEKYRSLTVEISGKVTSEEGSAPIKGIKVVPKGISSDVTTDLEGCYKINTELIPAELSSDMIIIEFKDMDGYENGSYSDKSVEFKLDLSDFPYMNKKIDIVLSEQKCNKK